MTDHSSTAEGATHKGLLPHEHEGVPRTTPADRKVVLGSETRAEIVVVVKDALSGPIRDITVVAREMTHVAGDLREAVQNLSAVMSETVHRGQVSMRSGRSTSQQGSRSRLKSRESRQTPTASSSSSKSAAEDQADDEFG